MGVRLNGQTTGYVELDAPATAGNNTLKFPNGNGSSGQVMTTDGSGNLSFTTPAATDLVTDTTPQLGGDLDVNGYDIGSVNNNDINLDPDGAGQVVFKGNATRGSGAIKLNCEVNSHGILLQGPPHSAGASYTLTLPNDTGTSGQLLTTNGSGVTSWSTVSASPTFQATADGALTDGMPVIITSSGNVKSSAAIKTEHTPTKTGEATITNNNVRDVAIAYDETNNWWITTFVEYQNGSTKIAPLVPQSDLANGVTVGQLTQLGNANSSGTALVWLPDVSRMVAAYTTSWGMYIKSFTSGGSGGSQTVTQQAANSFVGNGGEYMDLYYINTGITNFLAVYRKGSTIYGKMAEITGSVINRYNEFTIVNTYDTEPFASAYDGNGKLVVFYKDNNSSNYGKAVVCTLGTNTFSVGSPVTFASTSARLRKNCAAYDQTAGKFLVTYRDQNDSEDLKVVVGTVSGSSISFGTTVEYETGLNEIAAIKYDPAAGESIIVVSASHASATELRRVTISGTTPTVESPTAISSTDNQNFDLAFGKDHQRWCYAQNISNAGNAYLIKVTTSESQVTTENYIGISDGAYSNGDTATVQIVGSVDDAQSGLTPGQSYFVQSDGSLGLTADETVGSVFAGTAVSATKLIVKGQTRHYT